MSSSLRLAASTPDTSSATMSVAGRISFIRPTIWPTGMATAVGSAEPTHPLMRLAREDALQRHRQQLGSIPGLPCVGPPARQQTRRIPG